jgi:hypothetical protein
VKAKPILFDGGFRRKAGQENPWLAGSALCVLRDDRFRGLLRMRNFLNVIKALPSS